MIQLRQRNLCAKTCALLERHNLPPDCLEIEITESFAEGVESQAQSDFLRERGYDFVQGYFHSRPMPANDFMALLKEREGPARL